VAVAVYDLSTLTHYTGHDPHVFHYGRSAAEEADSQGRQIVELDGGSFHAEVPPEEGTRFVVYLPQGWRSQRPSCLGGSEPRAAI
jgi:hypothetical protein